MRRVDLRRSDDVGHRVDRGGLYTEGAWPVPVSPFQSPLETVTVPLMDLATIVTAATLGAQKMRASFKAARPKALPSIPLPVLRLAVGYGKMVSASDPATRAMRPQLKTRLAISEEGRLGVVCPAMRKYVQSA